MPEPARNTSLDAQREPHFPDLFPGEVRLFRDASNRLRLTVEGQRSYLDVKVVRAFPLSDPDGYIGFLDGKDKLIGLIREPDALDAESLALARKDMHRRYFTPTITEIFSMKEEFGVIYCDVDTDRGPRHFVGKGLRDLVQELGDGEMLFTDTDGNRYRIADWRRLDPRSQRMLENII